MENEYGDGKVLSLSPKNLTFYNYNQEWNSLIKKLAGFP